MMACLLTLVFFIAFTILPILYIKTCHCLDECAYFIDVPGESYTLDDIDGITIGSDKANGETIYRVMIQNRNVPDRRRKRGFGAADIYMVRNSSHFGLIYNLAMEHIIYTLTCLEVGYSETLELGIWDNRDNGYCNDSTLTISVTGAIPIFVENSTEVYVDQCSLPGTIIDVMSLTITNSGDCAKDWNCTANCTNDGKLFWTNHGTDVVSYFDGIDYGKTYHVEVTCTESGDVAPNITSDNSHIYEINFRENLTTCPTKTTVLMTQASTTVSVLTPTSHLHNTNEIKSFFDNNANAAAVFSVGGLAAVSMVTGGVYAVTKKLCEKKPQ